MVRRETIDGLYGAAAPGGGGGLAVAPRDFTRAVFREFRQRGYEALPVNPNAAEVEGGACYPSVAAIAPAVEAALVMLPPAAIPKAAEEWSTGIRRLWIWRAGPPMEEFCGSAASTWCRAIAR